MWAPIYTVRAQSHGPQHREQASHAEARLAGGSSGEFQELRGPDLTTGARKALMMPCFGSIGRDEEREKRENV